MRTLIFVVILTSVIFPPTICQTPSGDYQLGTIITVARNQNSSGDGRTDVARL
jgi:hypothetical protein